MEKLFQNIFNVSSEYFVDILVSRSFILLFVVLGAIISTIITKKLLLSSIEKVVAKTASSWDDTLLKNNVFGRLSHISPAIIIYLSAGLMFDDIPKIKLTVAGEGNQLKNYKQMVSDQGLSDIVNFAGWLNTNEIQQLAAKCSLGVFPSRIESFGLSVVEAMAGGLPVIATYTGAIPENIENGITGTLVPRENPNDLADALIKAIKDPVSQETLACKARELVQQKFSWDRAASKMIKLYKALRN